MQAQCPCGGGQSCIVDRRLLNDFVHEDFVFKKYNLPQRQHCFQEFTTDQETAIKKELNGSRTVQFNLSQE